MNSSTAPPRSSAASSATSRERYASRREGSASPTVNGGSYSATRLTAVPADAACSASAAPEETP